MNQSKIPVRYAKALFLLGKEKGILDSLSKEVGLLADFFVKTPFLMPWLRSPIMKMDEKKILLRRQFEGKVSPVIFKFTDLVINQKRERFFPDIFRNFLDFHKADAGIKTIILTTAMHVDKEIKQKISQRYTREDSLEHELQTRVKPSIIGGFMIQVDDVLYDATIATEIKRLNKELTGQLKAGLSG
jgi:F-type H+-transporting ATPase subunit delta